MKKRPEVSLLRSIVLATAFGIAACPMAVLGDDQYDHFKGKPANTLDEALANLKEYNGKLAAELQAGKLRLEQLHKIHELTYTLENALQKVEKEVEQIQETLENLHKASEYGRVDEANQAAMEYLKKAQKIAP